MIRHAFGPAALVIIGLLLPGACKDKSPAATGASASASAPPPPVSSAKLPPKKPVLLGNAERGKELIKTFECNRCHAGTGMEAADFHKDCFQCHRDIISGKFKVADAAKVAKWKKNVLMVQHVPSLEGAGRRLRREWLTSFLEQPQDLRPHLVPSMPRLALTAQQAADVAAHLTAGNVEPSYEPWPANAEAGRRLIENKACGSCHEFTGVDLPLKPALKDGESNAAIELAPDLRHTRDRLATNVLVAWLMQPEKMKPGTLMPNLGLTQQEARDIAEYISTTPLKRAPVHPVPKRLAKLERKVSFAEVQEKVLNRTCAHCHGNPDIARGDGGPGNTGGFGYKPRHLDLSKYSGIASGYIADDGERHSVFSPTRGAPRIVAALWARHDEQAGKPRSDLRGMPLGMPALPAEDIQVLESWIAQGRPR